MRSVPQRFQAIVSLVILVHACRPVAAATLSDVAATAAPEAIAPEASLAAAAIRVPAGFTLSVVASEPQLANPVAFCFDPAGRIFIAETHRVHRGVEDNRHHMDWVDDDLAARTVQDRRDFMVRRMGDRISEFTANSDQVRLLEDRDADGVYERSTIFSDGYSDVQDGAAAGVMWLDDRLLFTCIPSLWELRDADGDGVAEHKRSLADGFGVHIALFGHDLHGLTHGPDGKVYFSVGDRGLNVKLADGRTLSNPDSGAVIRCNPDGSDMELFATGLRNPQELVFNEFGDLFTVDNNSDSGDRARLVHIVEGMDAGWRMSYQYLPDRGPFNREKIWHTQNPDQPAAIVPPLTHLADGPSGLVRYPGTGLPAEHDGAFFLADFRGTPGLSGIREFWVEPHGATYRLAREKMFAEGVLATDCDFGPDGNFYLADWIEGWEGAGKGRIHRVVNDDAASTAERAATSKALREISTMDQGQRLDLLGHDDVRVRFAAQRQLVSAGAQSAEGLRTYALDKDRPLLGRIHAIWGVGELAEADPPLFAKMLPLLKDGDPEIRTQTAKALGRADAADDAAITKLAAVVVLLLADESPRVRAQAAITLGHLRHRDALAPLLAMIRENSDRDPVLRHAGAMALAETQSAADLLAAAKDAGDSERLALAVALGRQRSPLVAQLLSDSAEAIRLEAARAIWDAPIEQAYEPLAAALESVPSANEPLLRRSLAANNALGGPARLAALVQCGLRPNLSPAMREHTWQLISNWAAPSSRDPVHGLWRPVAPRSADEMLNTLRPALASIRDAGPNGAQGVVVAAELGVQEALPLLLHVLTNDQFAEELRVRALAAVTRGDEQLVAAAIEAAEQLELPALRSAARRVMIERFPERAVEKLQEAAEAASTDERQAALQMLAQLDHPAARAAIARWVERLEQGECPAELQLEVLEAAAASNDRAIKERHAVYVQRAEEQVGPHAASLHGGNAEAGRRIFEENTSLACRRCHSANPGEKLVGPNLADVGVRLSRNELLASIVKPNDKIAEGFQTTVLQLDTGKVVAGILRSEDDARLVLVDPDGKEIEVDPVTIEDRFEGLSAMPEDLMKQMTPRDLRNLVEFLSQCRNTSAAAPAADHGPAEPGAGN